MRYLELIKASR